VLDEFARLDHAPLVDPPVGAALLTYLATVLEFATQLIPIGCTTTRSRHLGPGAPLPRARGHRLRAPDNASSSPARRTWQARGPAASIAPLVVRSSAAPSNPVTMSTSQARPDCRHRPHIFLPCLFLQHSPLDGAPTYVLR
jgi:hypothetical protein